MNQSTEFLRLLFADKPVDNYVYVWTGKKSHWFKSIEDAGNFANSIQDENVYYGIATSPTDNGAYKRVLQETVNGLPGLWLDVDYGDEGHKKSRLPKTLDDAIDFVKSIFVEPSLIVHSGHGLQVYWLFKEFLTLATDDDRREARELTEKHKELFRRAAMAQGLEIDSTPDLARVFRIPGTMNVKSEPHVPCEIIDCNEVRYFVDELDDALAHIKLDVKPIRTPPLSPDAGNSGDKGDIILNAAAEPPFAKFRALSTFDPEFESTYLRKKRQKSQDSSPSAFDLSLANYAVNALWTRQEIADLIVASRREAGQDLKLRLDYYVRTIDKAFRDYEKNKALKNLEDSDEYDKESKFAFANDAIGVEITRVIQIKFDPPSYEIYIAEREKPIRMVDTAHLMNYRSWVIKFFEVGYTLNPLKKAAWDSVIRAINENIEREDSWDGATSIGMARSWVIKYLETNPIIQDENGEQRHTAAETSTPFEFNNKTYIFCESFADWLRMRNLETNPKALGTILREYGCLVKTMGFKLSVSPGSAEKRQTTRSVWLLPDNYQNWQE